MAARFETCRGGARSAEGAERSGRAAELLADLLGLGVAQLLENLEGLLPDRDRGPAPARVAVHVTEVGQDLSLAVARADIGEQRDGLLKALFRPGVMPQPLVAAAQRVQGAGL